MTKLMVEPNDSTEWGTYQVLLVIENSAGMLVAETELNIKVGDPCVPSYIELTTGYEYTARQNDNTTYQSINLLDDTETEFDFPTDAMINCPMEVIIGIELISVLSEENNQFLSPIDTIEQGGFSNNQKALDAPNMPIEFNAETGLIKFEPSTLDTAG